MNKWNGIGVPLLGTQLDTGKVFGSKGIEEWWCKATHKVVGHHADGVQFFVENLMNNKQISIYSIAVKQPQYRLVPDPEITAKEKAVDKMLSYAECKLDSLCCDFAENLYDAGYSTSESKAIDHWRTKYLKQYNDNGLISKELWSIPNRLAAAKIDGIREALTHCDINLHPVASALPGFAVLKQELVSYANLLEDKKDEV